MLLKRQQLCNADWKNYFIVQLQSSGSTHRGIAMEMNPPSHQLSQFWWLAADEVALDQPQGKEKMFYVTKLKNSE